MDAKKPNRLYRGFGGMLLIGLIFLSAGCEAIKNPASIVKDMMPPTPGEVAREVFDLYDADKRRRAINYLSAAPFGGEEAYVKLYRLMIDDPDPTVRAASVKALGLHGAISDVPMLTVRLRDVHVTVRWEASTALQKIHNPFAIKSLVTALQEDEDADVRMGCASALGQYAQAEVFDVLVGALSDPSHSVVREASRSLATLTGEELGTDGADWLNWQEKNVSNLFAAQRDYYWQPYKKPRGFLDRAQFWKEEKVVEPQLPTGIVEAES